MGQEWFSAAGRGDLGEVLDWIGRGIDVDLKNEFGWTALSEAALSCQVAVIRALLEHGADPNAEDLRGSTPVTWAVVRAQAWARDWPYRGEPDPRPMEMLLGAGGRLGLREAVLMGDDALARRLCDSDPSLNVSGEADFFVHDTYLMVATRLGFLDVARFLLDRGADIEGTDDLGATALMRAAEWGHPEIATLLIERGADVNSGYGGDETSLSEAAMHGQREIFDLLLSRGARRGILDAVAMDDAGLVAGWLRDGADPNKFYCSCGRLAMYAVRRGNAEIVRLLLDHGAAHYHEGLDDRPLLAEAARHGHLEVARLLIERGASPDGVGSDGLSPIDWASREGHAPVVDLLRRAGRG
jgi:uncharacterized protein